jgi:hypothetical protein
MNESEAYKKTSHCTNVTETKKNNNNTAGSDIAPPSFNAHESL